MRLIFLHAAASLLVALAAVTSAIAAPAFNARLASLQIEIWPEYDRPQALVILRAELAPDAALPAVLRLRIPAAAGAPTAVAYADATGNLLNLKFEREEAGQFVLVRFTTPQRSFHVEFYDPLASSQGEREYRYEWPGDFAVERLGVLVKEPAAASNISVSPQLGITGASPDGLRYRAAELGAIKAGERLPIAVRYTKSDPRSTSEILSGPQAGASSDQKQGRQNGWLWMVAAGTAAVLLAGALVLLLLGLRGGKRATPRPASVACPKCGRPAAPDDRFCGGCGKPLAKT